MLVKFSNETLLFVFIHFCSTPSDSLSVVVNVGSRTREIGRIKVRDGKITPECNKYWDDGTPNPFCDMRVKKLEKVNT